MRSQHSVIAQLASLKVEDLQRVRNELKGYIESKKEKGRRHTALLDLPEFKHVIASILKTDVDDEGLSVLPDGAFLKEVIPGIYAFTKNLADMLKHAVEGYAAANVDSESPMSPEDMQLFTVCLVREQINQQVESGAFTFEESAQALEKKCLLVDEIVSLIDTTGGASRVVSDLTAAVSSLAQNRAAFGEAELEKYKLLAEDITRADLAKKDRQTEVNLNFVQVALEIVEPELAGLRGDIRTYQAEEVETLRKLLKAAGVYLVQTGGIDNVAGIDSKTMKEIIRMLDHKNGDASSYYEDIVAGGEAYRGLKIMIDKCRFFVKSEEILNDQTQPVLNRVTNLQTHIATNGSVIEEHRSNKLLRACYAVLHFLNAKWGRSDSKEVLDEKISPKVMNTQRFFLSQRGTGGWGFTKPTTNTPDMTAEAKEEKKPSSAPRSGRSSRFPSG